MANYESSATKFKLYFNTGSAYTELKPLNLDLKELLVIFPLSTMVIILALMIVDVLLLLHLQKKEHGH